MAHKPGMFCWFECATNDVAASKAFYTRVFGWNAFDVPMPGGMEGHYTLLRVGETDIAGMYEQSGPEAEGIPSHWLAYVAVENTDESTTRAQSLGAKLLHGPMDVPGVGRMSFITDPTGAAIALSQMGEHSGSDAEASNLGWCELHTPDVAAAKAFYSELFGWQIKDDPSGAYTEFQVDGCSIGGMMAIPPEHREHMPPNWLLYALIDDCDATLALAEQSGGHIIVSGQDIPDVGRFGVLADPTGAAIAVIKLSGKHA